MLHLSAYNHSHMLKGVIAFMHCFLAQVASNFLIYHPCPTIRTIMIPSVSFKISSQLSTLGVEGGPLVLPAYVGRLDWQTFALGLKKQHLLHLYTYGNL